MYFKNLLIRRKIRLVQLADIIVADMNLIRNDVVIVNISLQNIKLIDSNLEDFMYFLKMVVGTGGTLLMPVHEGKYSKVLYPESYSKKSTAQLNYLINEVLREVPGSAEFNLASGSMYVWGKLVKWNSDSLKRDNNEIDKKDLPDTSYLLKSKIIGIGVPLSDPILHYSFDCLNYISAALINSSSDNNNGINFYSNKFIINGQHNLSDVIKSTSASNTIGHFEYDELKVFSKRGIHFFVINTGKFYNKMHLLLKNGITI